MCFLDPKADVTKSFVETSIHTKVPDYIAKIMIDNPYSHDNIYPLVQLTFMVIKVKCQL